MTTSSPSSQNPSAGSCDKQHFDRFGLIAGSGRFPILCAQSAQKLGINVVAVAHKGQTDPELEKYVHKTHWIKVGQLGRIIDILHSEGIRDAAMLGGIVKAVMFNDVMPDLLAITLAARLRTLNDDILLRGVCEEIEKRGITIHSATIFLQELLASPGLQTRREPNKKQYKDIDLGWNLAKEIGRLDIGQTIVVKDQVVLAVEAIEGTDEAIRRAGKLGGGKGLVVVKVSKPQQDQRFDLPASGPLTIATMNEAGADVLAIEQGKTILIDKEQLIENANKSRIALVAR